MNNKKGLGKGLSELLSVYDEQELKTSEIKPNAVVKSNSIKSGVDEIDINKIKANPNQPRKNFSQEGLDDLAASIKVHGIIQPIVLNVDGNDYMIIAGERRWRAAKMVGLETVPAIVKNYTAKQVKEISIIENLQREDLNPIEAARAIKQLMEEYNFTQEVVADRIGKSRSSIANTLRLLVLSPEVIKLVEEDRLSAGHAKCLVVIDDKNEQVRFASQASDNKMSVRELENVIKNYLHPKPVKEKEVITQSIELKDLANEMQRVFATKVSILGNDNKGRIYIDYYNRDDLDRIVDLLTLIKKQKLTLQDLSNFNKHLK